MNVWHDISPDRISAEDFYAVVEIRKGSKTKYELDRRQGCLSLTHTFDFHALPGKLRLHSSHIRRRQ